MTVSSKNKCNAPHVIDQRNEQQQQQRLSEEI